MIQDRIFNDLKDNRDPSLKGSLKVIVGELQRQSKKVLSDAEVIPILKKLIKYEEERLSKIPDVETSSYLQLLKKYLPQQATEEEIKAWIDNNIDFSKYKNKDQIVGVICKHFKQLASGKDIKIIVERDYNANTTC
jgi:uncharacterized protein